jgi:hypothetical protein
MIIGTVGEIWRCRVKSRGGERLDHCAVAMPALVGDRGWVLHYDVAREIRGAWHFPLLLTCAQPAILMKWAACSQVVTPDDPRNDIASEVFPIPFVGVTGLVSQWEMADG